MFGEQPTILELRVMEVIEMRCEFRPRNANWMSANSYVKKLGECLPFAARINLQHPSHRTNQPQIKAWRPPWVMPISRGLSP
jgi:hypothetical protein